MTSDTDHLQTRAMEQQRIRSTCYHPTGTFVPFPREAIEQSIPERFEEMVRLYPERLAIKTAHEALTYTELNQRANHVAHAILAQRGDAEEPVAVFLDKGTCLIATFLGVLKAGKIYVPLDPLYPEARNRFILADTQASLIVTDAMYRSTVETWGAPHQRVFAIEALEASRPQPDPGLALSPDTLSYILYTSGSTGRPKGVLQNHRNILHSVMRPTNSLHFCAEDRLSLLSSASFVGGVRDILSALLNGGAILPFPLATTSVSALASWLRQEDITVFNAVVTVFRHFLNTLTGNERIPSLRMIKSGSEPLTGQDVEQFKRYMQPPCILYAGLGTTEFGSGTCYLMDHHTELPTGSIVPAGYAFEDITLLVCDEAGTPLGSGRTGELAVKSRYAALGYWKRPELTAEKFLQDPEDSEMRLYRTGDMGYMHPDGCLVLLGRQDHQVKIRGYRVETGEIENCLRGLAEVKEAVVIPRESTSGDKRLVAYIVPTPGTRPASGTLPHLLRNKLPAHMVPSVFVVLDQLPLTLNGKVDFQALPAPTRARPDLPTPCMAPRSLLERELTRIWSDILELDDIGIHDHFLDLGGHSLLATQLLSRIVQTFKVKLPLRALLDAPTIAAMALVITQHRLSRADPHTVARLLAEVEALSAGEESPRSADS